ncbi:MAG: RagB/SusD family nutrient uptake outer membrane protein [Microscillaceae bacterium]|nr:RagB/SusD family nutrient uptake outer membrane protein [Microscillaceae bacterium]
MKYFNLKIWSLIAALSLTTCTGDLDVVPIDDDEITSATFFDSPEAFAQVLAKLYAGFTLTGQQGPAGQPDVAGIDEGFSSYLRMYWYHQELTTDEAVIGWNDQTIQDFHQHDWGSADLFITGLYSRLFFQITLANEFIRQANNSSDATVKAYAAEARFVRALSYWHALDLFENVPFVTEEDGIGAFLPAQTNAQDLFAYIESELLEIEPLMAEPGQDSYYARADKGAVWMLLAKLYLNAELHVGTPRYDDAITWLDKIVNSPAYSLDPNYDNLFRADNHTSNENIFVFSHDAKSQSFGGMNFVIHAAVGGNMAASDFGIDGGWSGTRTTSAFVDLFEDQSGNSDTRANFHTPGQRKEIEDIGVFTDGFAITKFRNLTSGGSAGARGDFVDTDFALFRLADAYLMYAEATLRGGNGSLSTALGYINALRERAYGDSDNNIEQSDLNLDFIIDERGRELYWECHRRTDLRRFGLYTGGAYLWPWKGGVAEGRATSNIYEIFPIPSADLAANPNLTQNPGY